MTTLLSAVLGLFWLFAPALGATTSPTPVDTARRPNRVEHYLDAPTRRWRGSVGLHPITVSLDSLWRGDYRGKYHYDRRGQDISLNKEPAKAPPGLTLGERDADYRPSGSFLLGPTIGPELVGTWRSADGHRTLPVLLHETYDDGVRYQVEHWNLTRFLAPDATSGPTGDSALFRGDYLRIALPQNPAAAQRIQLVLGPPAAPLRMPYVLDTLLRNRQAEQLGFYFIGEKYVAYNSNQLLSVVQLDRFSTAPDAGYYSHEWSQSHVFDLRTGKQLTLADLLVAGYQPKLRQLLLQKLRPIGESNAYYDGIGSNGKLPAGGFVVTGTGLNFTYDDRDDESLAYPGPYHADREIEIEISYEALLPLIKLAGPLAPVLKERNLLPKNKEAHLQVHK